MRSDEDIELNDRIKSLELKIDLLIPEIRNSNKQLSNIIIGNGHPEEGVVFRLTQLEKMIFIDRNIQL